MKIIWRVAPKPTGRFGSFRKRPWPSAHYKDEKESPAFYITCEDEYRTIDAREGTHCSLIIRITNHSVKPFEWRQLKQQASTLKDAKILCENALLTHPHFAPKDGTA